MSAHEELDRLVALSGEAGWAVRDSRALGVLWFTRGPDYMHLGVNAAGELLSLYRGVQGRPSRFWAAGRDLATGAIPDRLALIERALTEQEQLR